MRLQTIYGEPAQKNVNYILNACLRYSNLARMLNKENVELCQQIVSFLIESVQGPCLENQKCLIQNKIVDIIKELFMMFNSKNDYLSRGFDTEELQEKVNTFVSFNSRLLLSLIEANPDNTICLQLV